MQGQENKKPIQDLKLPDGYNVQVLITGLAVCDLDSNVSKIRILRNVDHHELTLTVHQRDIESGSISSSDPLKLNNNQNIEILGLGSTSPSGYIYQNASSNQSMDYFVKLRSLHGKEIDYKDGMEAKTTLLKLSGFEFYSHKRTENNFQFFLDNRAQGQKEKFCSVLGGYAKYDEELKIRIDGRDQQFPSLLFDKPDGNSYTYTIEIDNDCKDIEKCKSEEEDFKYIYGIVEERDNPTRKFALKMVKEPKASTGTGACLPVCRTC